MSWVIFALVALVCYALIRGGAKLISLVLGGRFSAYRQLAADLGGDTNRAGWPIPRPSASPTRGQQSGSGSRRRSRGSSTRRELGW